MTSGYKRVFISDTGGYIDQHTTQSGAEAKDNLTIAYFLAERGERVRLLPVDDTPGVKNPDATINEMVWEFKTLKTSSVNALDKAIQRGKDQADNILIHAPDSMSVGALQEGVFNRVHRSPSIQKIRLLHKGLLAEFTRGHILAPHFRLK